MGLLEGRRALVTGGARGIGRAVVERFRREGARVAVLDVDAEGSREVASAVSGVAVVADVTDASAVERAVGEAVEALGGLDTLVLNAGAGSLARLHAYSPEAFDRLVRVNLHGAFLPLRAAVPALLDAGRAAVVFNASGSASRPTSGEMPYAAAKAGVEAMTRAAALEYGPRIRVNCVSPGIVRTRLTEPLLEAGLLDPVFLELPLRRPGVPEEVADVILFLASDLARYVTGQVLLVDGGLALPQVGIDGVLRGLLDRLDPGGGPPGGVEEAEGGSS